MEKQTTVLISCVSWTVGPKNCILTGYSRAPCKRRRCCVGTDVSGAIVAVATQETMEKQHTEEEEEEERRRSDELRREREDDCFI